MKTLTMLALLQGEVDEGLTLGEIIAGIPHDAAAIVVYVLVGASIGLVVWSGRRSGPREPRQG
jgi:hypothetical protein